MKVMKTNWWRDSDSNRGHEALQATALPTELSRHEFEPAEAKKVLANDTENRPVFQLARVCVVLGMPIRILLMVPI
jgi:hypothetical protein